MNPSIPISNIVNITPAVLANGGTGATMSALLLSTQSPYPCMEYTSASSVGSTFGLTSAEYKFAVPYFKGFDNADKTPTKLYISKVNETVMSASLISGSFQGVTLSQLQQIKGTLTITVNGTAETGTVDLSTATSFSEGANLIASAFTSGDIVAGYLSMINAFVISTSKASDSASLSFATGTASTELALTQASGAILNNYVNEDTTAETIMQKATDYTLDFVSITHTDDAYFTQSLKELLSTWTSNQGGAYWFVPWALETGATTPNNTASLGGWVQASTNSGTTPLYSTIDKSALASAYPASLNWDLQNGNTTLDFRQQSGLTADVTSKSVADALVSNGYMFYGAYASAVNRYQFFRNSIVSGDFNWIQKYVINLRLRARFTDASINMFQGQRAIPYNKDGKATVRAYMQDPIDEMVLYGGIQAGVDLTSAEKNIINTTTGVSGAADQVFTTGWFLYIGDASASARTNRTSFPMIFYYTDGDSLQSLSMTVTNVQ